MFSRSIRCLTTASLLALFVLEPALAVAPVYAQTPAITPLAAINCPDCWAGYSDVAAAGSVTMVTATVVQQAVICNPANALSQEVADMVAIDGIYGPGDFLYVTTYALCAEGFSTPYYYMADSGPGGTILGAPISPGDKITMKVSVSAGMVHFSFKDATSGKKGSDSESATGFVLRSATCATSMAYLYSLAQFTKAPFRNCKATIGGTTAAIGAFGTAATLNKYTCVDSTGKVVLAKPSSLSAVLSGFKVTWKAAGP